MNAKSHIVVVKFYPSYIIYFSTYCIFQHIQYIFNILYSIKGWYLICIKNAYLQNDILTRFMLFASSWDLKSTLSQELAPVLFYIVQKFYLSGLDADQWKVILLKGSLCKLCLNFPAFTRYFTCKWPASAQVYCFFMQRTLKIACEKFKYQGKN